MLTLRLPDPEPTSRTTQYLVPPARDIAVLVVNSARSGAPRTRETSAGAVSVPFVKALAAGRPPLASAWIATRGETPASAATPSNTEVSW